MNKKEKEYKVEVVETHILYVYAKSEEEAIELAEAEAFSEVPDSVESKIVETINLYNDVEE